VVKILNEKGAFLLKGGVSEVAKYLDVSEATIYRYLNKIK
ncbi:helix-turn-helix domain-containing protein, partial [Bacillus sp. SIMBA_069]